MKNIANMKNRCDPYGRIVAHPARGLLMGNRGCLHDDDGKIVRQSARTAWISCLPTWPGVRRTLMAPGHYTELFFLDEATALAAGHRPCGSCRPEALLSFKQAWAVAHHLSHLPRVGEIDNTLRQASWDGVGVVDALPDGAMVDVDGKPLLRWAGAWLAWSFDGYTSFTLSAQPVMPITPKAIIEVLRAGYAPIMHASGQGALPVV